MIIDLKKILCGIILGAVIICFFYYNILPDILLIALLMLDSYLIGRKLNINNELAEKMIMKTAIGLGVIGLLIYFILFFGYGSKSVYMVVLILPCLFSLIDLDSAKKDILAVGNSIKEFYRKNTLICIMCFIAFILYVAYGSAPMSRYDTLTKHLPITVYAATTGRWYNDVTESLVYGEPMVLQYTYSTLFYSLGCYKAITLFNVILYFQLCLILFLFVKKIYSESSGIVLFVILLTTPFFFDYATRFYLEILPLYFLFSGILCIADLNSEKIWDNIEYIALILGFSLFVKLTHICTMVIIVFIMMVKCLEFAWKNKEVPKCIFKFGKCMVLGILPSITSLVNIWYKTGNPFFPSYNGIFKSPYFPTYNFEDPFTNKLTVSWKSLMDIVFHTTSNVEMYPLGLGIYLLFILIVPLACVLIFIRYRNLKYVAWCVIAIASYILNTVTTYNLRYYFSVWIIMACVISIAIEVCTHIDKFKILSKTSVLIICVIIALPNVQYFENYESLPFYLQKDESVVKNEFCDLFEYIPENKRVLGVTNSNQFKGNYKGYYASTTWHNFGMIDFIEAGEYNWNDYIRSFDYIVIDKSIKDTNIKKGLIGLMKSVTNEDPYIENSIVAIYKVKEKTDVEEHVDPIEIEQASFTARRRMKYNGN